ncbi:MAG TPA: IS200/IS605 family transposase [Pyrinomonadaceae bacterium]
MHPHFTALDAAYQLHYYLSFKTHFLKPFFADCRAPSLVESVLNDVCDRERYHLLETNIDQEHLRLLVSLLPTQTVVDTVKRLKGNLQNQFRKELNIHDLWARGYFASSSGTVDQLRVQRYIDSQISHHGFRGEWTRPLKYLNPHFKTPAYEFAHCVSLLKYHLVFVTQNRIAVFDEAIAPSLFDYIVAVGKRREFAVERISLLPDHMHMLIEGVPSISVQDYAFAILNNTQQWMAKNYSGVLKATGAWNVWQQSYYAGTVGEYTTGQVKSFLRG